MHINTKLWIIIINYNGIYDTMECIESILKSDYTAEILIIDNASDNGEGEILEKEYTNIHVIKSKENLGFAGGNNLGIWFAVEHGADYIMLLNNDTVIDSNMICELFKNCNTTDIVTPRMYYYDRRDIVWYSGGDIDKLSGNIKSRYFGKSQKELPNRIERCSFATGCCILISVELIKKLGGLKEEYFMYCEDTELSLRVIESGGAIKVIANARLWHKVSSSTGGSGSALSIYYSSRNRLCYINEHKDYFFATAHIWTVISRIIRIVQYILMRNDLWKSYYKALKDYKNGNMGKQPYK